MLFSPHTKTANVAGDPEWTITAIRSILTNEKYCGDVLLQKTYISDCISRKVIRNTGQFPMYLVQNNHDGIVDRKTFDAVQAEMAQRNAGKSPSKKNAPTGMTSYASKYALSERLVCGECGTLYRRCTWSKRGKKRIVWRCVSRLDYGTKYCHNSPTLDEKPLQLRGQVFEIDGYSFFTMGGASSHDIEDGILNPKAPDFEEQYWMLRRMGTRFRVNHYSWWKQELPSDDEYAEARINLDRVGYKVDYIITHCAPSSIEDKLGKGGYVHDRLTDFLEEVKEKAKFHYWLFGHYHDNQIIDDRFVLLWEQIVQVV